MIGSQCTVGVLDIHVHLYDVKTSSLLIDVVAATDKKTNDVDEEMLQRLFLQVGGDVQ